MAMALPVVRTLADTVNLDKTVWPYTAQLYDLPQQFLQAATEPATLETLYTSTNPLVTAVGLSIALMPIFFVISEINRNYSQVDRVWSILPAIYAVHYAVYAHLTGLPSNRVDAAAAISVIWSVRLTYNYWRKGGYEIGSEDYRWEIIQKKVGKLAFTLFNIIFISTQQSILLAAVTFPCYALLLSERLTGEGLLPVDIAFTGFLAVLIAIEYTADEQQWNFHQAKYAYQKSAKSPDGYSPVDLDRGFNTTGLWAYTRHPNFACEQTVWVTLYLWACQISGTAYNWTGVGAAFYLMLFQGSTWLTELITNGKYPEYKEYQKQVGMFVPIPGYKWRPEQVDTKYYSLRKRQ